MTLYIGVDFHPYQQTVAWCDSKTGETETSTLGHDLEDVRRFYEEMPSGIVGIEACCKARWFENLLTETGHELKFGNPALIRKRATSRHKSDKRDAELILRLLTNDEFPEVWRRSKANNEVLDILRLRHSLVGQRTQTYNRLQALARSFGLPKGKMKSECYKLLVKNTKVGEAEALQRSQLFKLVENLDSQILELETWLRKRAKQNDQVQLLQTQKGVGYLSSLALVNAIGDISRFDRPTKQVPAYIGLDPLEDESAGKRKQSNISKAGCWITRFLIGQSAHICTRYDTNLKAFYKRLSKKKPNGVAKTATARKLLVKLSIMLRDNITAEEFDRRGRTVNDTRGCLGLKDPLSD